MVKSKEDTKISRRDFLKEAIEKLNERTVRFEWTVFEVTPEREDDDGRYVSPKYEQVSPFYTDKFWAEDYVRNHEPDPGKKLKIMRRRLVRTEQWLWG